MRVQIDHYDRISHYDTTTNILTHLDHGTKTNTAMRCEGFQEADILYNIYQKCNERQRKKLQAAHLS